MDTYSSLRNAVAYTRVSTEKQGRSGFGNQAQTVQIDEFAAGCNYRIIKRFVDVGSGVGAESFDHLYNLKAALRYARRYRLPIIVSAYDRLSRHLPTLSTLVGASGVRIISASDGQSPDAAVIRARQERAQFEAEETSRRTRSALQSRRQRGVPLGNRVNLREAQEAGAAANRRAAELRDRVLAGILGDSVGLPPARAAARLNDLGTLSPRGRPWTASALRRPLARIRAGRSARRCSGMESDWGRF